jgi:hypothetical protein
MLSAGSDHLTRLLKADVPRVGQQACVFGTETKSQRESGVSRQVALFLARFPPQIVCYRSHGYSIASGG